MPGRAKTRKDVVEIPVEDLFSMLLGQVRYSMGRMSYIVGVCSRHVHEYWPRLQASQRGVLLRDVTEELARYEQAGRKCGMDFDHREWVALREWMREHLND